MIRRLVDSVDGVHHIALLLIALPLEGEEEPAIDQTYSFAQLPQAGLIPAVERYLEFTRRMVELNRDLTVKWAQAASALSGVAGEQVELACRSPEVSAWRLLRGRRARLRVPRGSVSCR
jgi:hypothetical protein